jgi:hypothetical protein
MITGVLFVDLLRDIRRLLRWVVGDSIPSSESRTWRAVGVAAGDHGLKADPGAVSGAVRRWLVELANRALGRN